MRPPKGFTSSLPNRWRYWILAVGLGVSAALGLIGSMQHGVPERLNHAFLDIFARYAATGAVSESSIVVDVDDVSLASVGQWPWPRYRMASLVERIAAAGPGAIGMDILFAEPDRTSLKNIQQSYKRDFDVDLTFNGASANLTDNDGYLGQVLRKTGTVGARYFYFDHVSKGQLIGKPQFQFEGLTDQLSLNDAPGVLDNTPEIASQLGHNGFINTQTDADGILRRVPMLIWHKGVIYPQIALATYMRSQGLTAASIERDTHGLLLRVGKQLIPIDRKGYALIRLEGPSQRYPAISAVEVLSGDADAQQTREWIKDSIKGKLVFIGSSAAGLNDLHNTLFDAQFPGLKLQSVIADNIVSNSFIRQPSWHDAAVLWGSIIAGLLVAAIFILSRGPVQLCIATTALAAALLLLSAGLFWQGGLFVSPAFVLLTIAVLFALFTTVRFAIEKQQTYIWFRKLANAQQVAMVSMAAVAETRDPETGAHIKRTQHYVKAIAEELRKRGQYLATLTPEYIGLLFASAPLHDIGKVGVPDHILLKPGKHTFEEFEQMKKHAEYGRDIIQSAAGRIEGENFLRIAAEIAYGHHERWNGSGYPRGLAGEDIPLCARIMTIADVYDALISRRCYKEPFPHVEAFAIMRESRGKIFDPEILDVFFSIELQIVDIAATYRDEPEPRHGMSKALPPRDARPRAPWKHRDAPVSGRDRHR